jgi:hypothetical protein
MDGCRQHSGVTDSQIGSRRQRSPSADGGASSGPIRSRAKSDSSVAAGIAQGAGRAQRRRDQGGALVPRARSGELQLWGVVVMRPAIAGPHRSRNSLRCKPFRDIAIAAEAPLVAILEQFRCKRRPVNVHHFHHALTAQLVTHRAAARGAERAGRRCLRGEGTG